MQKRKKTLKHRLEYVIFICFVTLIRISPLFLLNFNRKLLRFIFGLVSKRHPGIVAKNLKLAYPDYSDDQRARLTEEIYRHFSTVAVEDIFIFVKRKPEKILRPVQVVNLEYLEQALEKKRGVILFSAHFGNWELVPYILSRRLDVTLNSIARRMDNPLIEKRVLAFRKYMGSAVIDKKNALRTMLKRLDDNGIVYLLIDQNTIEREAVFVEFFGETVAAVPSVSKLHLKRDIPVIPLFLHYEPDRIVLELQPEINAAQLCKERQEKDGNAGSDSQCIHALTQRCTSIIEEKIKQHPEQWLWFHNRWKTKPGGGTVSKPNPAAGDDMNNGGKK